MIKRIVKMTFRADKTDEFLAIFEENARKIRNFPGCQQLELLRSTEGSQNIFFTYSQWDGTASLEAYRRSALFGKTWKRTKALFADKPEAWTLNLCQKLS
ncbi:MAG: antibiotic biosynthesis monooxygenase family protein [Saprospiraceae bacterium]|nr:antibiotic biosynthesis monooxygenase family protein [Saprospiraceae bacterium]